MTLDAACLARAVGITPALGAVILPHFNATAQRFEIFTAARQAAFLAETAWESEKFSKLEENLYYTSPERIARVFRTAFDLNKDKVIEPEEIEFAKAYIRNPEKLANRAYASKYGNGPEESGDGSKYRGRGWMGLTFKGDYILCGTALGVDLAAHPELLAGHEYGALSAGWIWARKKLNELADVSNIDAISLKINPGGAGLAERRELYKKCREVLG